MSVFTMVAIIVAFSVTAGVISQYLKLQEKKAKAAKVEIPPEFLDKFAKLEDRVRVLEKISTDPTNRLRRQIDDLENI